MQGKIKGMALLFKEGNGEMVLSGIRAIRCLTFGRFCLIMSDINLIIRFFKKGGDMVEKTFKIEELIGQELKGFRIEEMTEVYRVDDDGRRSRSVGLFRNNDIAQAFAATQVDSPWHKTRKLVVITDGQICFLPGEIFAIMDDEQAALETRQKILKKLSAAERKFLKI